MSFTPTSGVREGARGDLSSPEVGPGTPGQSCLPVVEVWCCPAVSPRHPRSRPRGPQLHGKYYAPPQPSHVTSLSLSLSVCHLGHVLPYLAHKVFVRLPRGARALKALREGVKYRLARHRNAGIGGGERSGGRPYWKEGVGDLAFSLAAPHAHPIPIICTAGHRVAWPGGKQALIQQGQRGPSGTDDKGKGPSSLHPGQSLGPAGAERGASRVYGLLGQVLASQLCPTPSCNKT